ncbi:MAG: flagellar hook-associated protein FlgK [Pseudomonadota bacterium]
MAGLSMVLNTAKQALAAQQIGLNVTGHNIANVNTPAFSRQSTVQSTQLPANFAGLNLGTGVSVDAVIRSSDELLENRLMDQQSTLARYEEAQSYMSILENLFNENSETSLSSRLSAFWNGWSELSNMPAGVSERLGVYDAGEQMAEQFQSLSENMRQIQIDLDQEILAGVDTINTLTEQIAALNLDIIGSSVTGNPNDQLDKRNALVTQLAELIDLQAYEQPNGSLTVATGTGHVLVSAGETFQLDTRSGKVNWVNSHDIGVDITDRIKGGKIGGWLELRDEIIPQFNQDLDALAEGVIWSVNLQHSQGVGLGFFSDPVTGAYQTNSSELFDTLDFGDRIDYSGDFKMWIKNTLVDPATLSDISVDMDVADVTVDGWGGGAPGSFQYKVTVTTGGVVGPAGVDPVLSWEKFNPDGSATGLTGTTTVTDVDTLSVPVDGLAFNISAGALNEGNTFAINTDVAGNEDSLKLNSVTGSADSSLDTYVFTAKTGGVVGTDSIEIEWSNGAKEGVITLDPTASPLTVEVDGMTLDFASGTVFAGDTFTVVSDASGTPTLQLPSEWHWTLSSFAAAFNSAAVAVPGVVASVTSDNELKFTPLSGYEFAFSDDQVQDSGVAAALGFNTFFSGGSAEDIEVNSVLQDNDYIAAARIDGTTGTYGVGDTRNAIAIADIQYESSEFSQWSYDRRYGDRSEVTSLTAEGYYQGMIGSMGIKAASINRNAEFNQTTMGMITDQRNSISGVNLDEEMINMMKYQHGFAVASKLLTVADEMMETLLAMK